MLTLRELAESQPCYMRLAPFCDCDSAKTVLAHIRIGGNSGTALKPPDVCGLPACNTCHAIIDGRMPQKVYTPVMLRAETLRAQNQWLEWLWKREYIILGGIAA